MRLVLLLIHIISVQIHHAEKENFLVSVETNETASCKEVYQVEEVTYVEIVNFLINDHLV